MSSIWSHDEEAQRLRARFSSVPNKAQWAREYKLKGGPSMLNQYLKGWRHIGLDAAVVFARGFGVSLEDISPRLAQQQLARSIVPVVEAKPSTVVAMEPKRDPVGSSVHDALTTLHQAISKAAPENLPRLRLAMAALVEGVDPEAHIEQLVKLLSSPYRKRRSA